MPTLFQEHAARWHDCTRCPLHEVRQRVVLARGKVPCDLLFVGEAPGQSEDVIGQPFVGPAGRLLDRIVRKSVPEGVRVAFTNLVACVPYEFDADGNRGKASEPEPESIAACAPRLVEFVRIAAPRLIVAVGKLADDYLKQGYKHSVKLPRPTPTVTIVHPAAILRANVAQQGLMEQRAVVTVTNACEEYLLTER